MKSDPVNLARITETFGDDPEFLSEIYSMYLADTRARIEDLACCVEEGDAGGCHHIAHTIKGASANIGAKVMQSLSQELEESSRESEQLDKDLAVEVLGALRGEFQDVCDFLDKFLSSKV